MLSVQVNVGQINGIALRTGKSIAQRHIRLAKEPGHHENRGCRVAAAVHAQIQHDIPDGAVFPLDLVVGIDDQVDRIPGIVKVNARVV